MKLKKIFLYLSVILLIGAGSFGGYWLYNKLKNLNEFLPGITEITLIQADIHSDTAFVEVSAIVKNNAPYPMDIDSIVCDLTLDGTQIVSTSQYIGVHQKSYESDTLKFAVQIPISLTRNKIKSLQGTDSAGVELHASIVYSGRKFNLARGKQVAVPIPPELRLLRTEKKEFSFLKKNVKVDLYLELLNPGKIVSLDIHDLKYNLVIGNDMKTIGNLQKDIHIRPKSSQIVKFPLNFQMKNPGKTILKIWKDEDMVPFRLKLTGTIDAAGLKRIPVIITIAGKLEIVNEQKKKIDKHRKREKRKRDRKKRNS